MPYKLLVVDLDGTLIGKAGAIREDDIHALTGARNKGIKVALSTGRMPQACSGFFTKLPLDGFHIFYDGALVSRFPGGPAIFSQGLGKDLARDVVLQARQRHLYLEIYTTRAYFTEKRTEATTIHSRLLGIEPEVKDLLDVVSQEGEIIKAGSIIQSEPERTNLQEFEKYFQGRLRVTTATAADFPDVVFVNLVHSSVSKGKALEALVRHIGITSEEVMAIGDGENDIPLLETAGMGIAMGNASAKVKMAARAVTLRQEEGGVAFAIKKYLEI